MEIEASSPLEKAGESEVDFSIVQLLETSPGFRRWLVAQATPQLEIEEYLGAVFHAIYAGEGESDIEFGFRTPEGERHLVLIENKIDESFQPDQVERYYRRGQFRVNRGDWDSFTVCLLAPVTYISRENESQFDSVIHYEAVLDHLNELTHDSAEFFQEIFGSTERESSTTDASAELRSIADAFQNRTEIPELRQSVKHRKRIGFRSSHPQHPDAIQYDVYIAKTGDDGRTEVRLQIVDTENLTEEKREAFKSIVSEHIDSLPGYEEKLHREKNVAVTSVLHDEAVQNSSLGSYSDVIAEELHVLSDIFHPLFIRSSVS